jgi:hypothetical protein
MAETLSPKTSKALGITDPLKELTSKAEEAGRKELEASSAIEKLEIDKAVSEAERTREKAKTTLAGTEEATKRLIETQTPLKEQKSEVDKALMDKNFEPSKENLQDKAALFSLINVIGFAIGTGGKQNSMMAMHAMNGMLEGHQKGRADLFKAEQVKFEKNFKALQQKATFLESELRHSLEDFTRDKRAADERAAVAFAESGANFMKQYAEKYGLVEAHKRAVEVKRSADKAVADYERDQRRNQENIEKERRHLADMKELKQFGASLKGGGGRAGDSGLSQKEIFEDTAKAIANYGEKPPALRDPQRNALLSRARQLNPNYNEAGYGDRDIAYRNWTNPNGYGAKQIAAFTTVAGHLDTLGKLADALNNKDTPAINSALNWFQTATGDANVTNFNAAKQAVAAETIKAITGTAGALRDREEAQAIFSAAQSPTQIKGAINTVKELINSRLETSAAIYETGTGRKNFDDLLPPVVKQTFRKKSSGLYPASSLPPASVDSSIPTGAPQISASSDSGLSQAEKEELAALKAKHGRK